MRFDVSISDMGTFHSQSARPCYPSRGIVEEGEIQELEVDHSGRSSFTLAATDESFSISPTAPKYGLPFGRDRLILTAVATLAV